MIFAAPSAHAAQIADFVFIIDTSKSMRRDLRMLVPNLADFDDAMDAAGIDARYSLVRFGTSRIGKGPTVPELVVDFTSDFEEFQMGLDTLQDHIVEKTEAGSEAILFALDTLVFRDDAVPNIILYTDENDDSPVELPSGDFNTERREPPFFWNRSERTAAFQARLDEASAGMIDKGSLLNLIIRPSIRNAQHQYGIPDATVLNPDGSLDLEATYENLVLAERDRSLQAQLLDADLAARSFLIRDARRRNTADAFWEEFIEAKTREILDVPEPGTPLLLAGSLVAFAAARRSRSR